MAAALFNKKIAEMGLSDQCQARSAGTWATDGAPAAHEGRKVMNEMGLDTSGHRSRGVTREIIYNVDLILTMEEGHKEALQIEYPEKKDIIWLLSEMAGPAYSIPDPYGKGSGDFREIAVELENHIERGITNILARVDSSLLEGSFPDHEELRN